LDGFIMSNMPAWAKLVAAGSAMPSATKTTAETNAFRLAMLSSPRMIVMGTLLSASPALTPGNACVPG
jgi:hypothetical protein